MRDWTPSSWKNFPAHQQPSYEDPVQLEASVARLRELPPIVSFGEVEKLKAQLAEAAQGRRFILHGGDCAERFTDCNSRSILNKLKILLQMSLVLTYGARRPVVRIGRMAGQFAKPRSQDRELVNGVEMPVFRGDNVNDSAADPLSRRPDPTRLERGYFHSVATINFVRALLDGGFASLQAPEHWQLDFTRNDAPSREYQEIADRIRDAIGYFQSLEGLSQEVHEVEFFTSHEGLLLPYEEALTRQPRSGGPHYNLGAHFLWVGERTRQLDSAHVEYFRGIANPIGVKVGGSMPPEDLVRLVETLNPSNEPGRITLISRMGATRAGQKLPALIRAIKASGQTVLWSCDPMHGNTVTMDGYKTRDFANVVLEFTETFEVHLSEGTQLNGVHFELTGEDVTECIGGMSGLSAADLKRSYQTGCDPRLNYAQSMEVAFLISRMLRDQRPREHAAPVRRDW
jgi:3-deoxy-7-phosphoheptulonate synthase